MNKRIRKKKAKQEAEYWQRRREEMRKDGFWRRAQPMREDPTWTRGAERGVWLYTFNYVRPMTKAGSGQ